MNEIARFEFGRNWARYLRMVTEERVAAAERSLQEMFEVSTMEGLRFLDIGSGSGLFSLAARNLGASVHSFDYDPDSVACTDELKARFRPNDVQWQVEQGDVLDQRYLERLGTFDAVYSWGVLHHTGEMWQSLENVVPLVTPGGHLFLALYNDQRWLSAYWKGVKAAYNKSAFWRWIVIAMHTPYFMGRHAARTLFTRSATRRRGMDAWRDMFDWLGGHPFEVARPEEVLEFYRRRGFNLERMTTVDGRLGCNEFVFRRVSMDH